MSTVTEGWITAALSSTQCDEVYFFMGNEYVLINYPPADTKADYVIAGPGPISGGFASLAATFFAEWGINSSFRSHHGTEAFIFSRSLCALMDFAPHTKNDKILKGPLTIGQMFHFFKGQYLKKNPAPIHENAG